jgi:hypothetical protein
MHIIADRQTCISSPNENDNRQSANYIILLTWRCKEGLIKCTSSPTDKHAHHRRPTNMHIIANRQTCISSPNENDNRQSANYIILLTKECKSSAYINADFNVNESAEWKYQSAIRQLYYLINKNARL